MMLRSLQQRLAALDTDCGHEAVLAAVQVLRETGTAPPGPAGDRAAELWKTASGWIRHDGVRALWCYCQVTGIGLAELRFPSA